MADQFIYDHSIVNPKDDSPFLSKEILYLLDQQNGNYTSQITFDSSSFSNNGKYLDYQNSYLEIPYQITWAGTAIGTNAGNPYSAGMKNGGGIQVIDSMSVKI